MMTSLKYLVIDISQICLVNPKTLRQSGSIDEKLKDDVEPRKSSRKRKKADMEVYTKK